SAGMIRELRLPGKKFGDNYLVVKVCLQSTVVIYRPVCANSKCQSRSARERPASRSPGLKARLLGIRSGRDSRLGERDAGRSQGVIGDPGLRNYGWRLAGIVFACLSLSPGSAISFSISAISAGTKADRFS